MPVTIENPAGGTAIRPLTIPKVPEAEHQALRARIAATRWPDPETVTDESQGVPLAMMQELAGYWATDYDWRRCEETLQIIGPLTDPAAHGAAASDAFHLVIPTLPGYGYSGKPREAGWDPARIARAWVVLMKRLGYPRFASQGGDWGGAITNVMGQQAPPELLGIHVNLQATSPERRPGQHHAVLADRHGSLCGPPVLGKQGQPVQRRRRLGPGRRERLSRRELPAPRSWTQQAYHNLIYYNKPATGGHFAAWEQPQLFAAEVRAGLGRGANRSKQERMADER